MMNTVLGGTTHRDATADEGWPAEPEGMVALGP
jgi:hypothetical protein